MVATDADGVHPVHVAEVPGVDDGLQVGNHQHAPQRADGLVLGAVHLLQAVAGRAGLPATGDGAAVAGHLPVQVLVGQQDAGEVAGLLPLPQPPVPDGQVAEHEGHVHVTGRSRQTECLGGHVLGGGGVDFPHRLLEPLRVRQGDLGGAPQGEGLEVLGAHHGAHTGPSGGAAVVVHHRRHLYPALPGGADAEDARLRVPQQFPDPFLGGVGVQAPEVGRVVQAGLPLHDGEPDGAVGSPGDDDAVVPGEAEFGPHKAPGVGLPPDAGEGGERADAQPSRRGHRGAHQWAGHQDEGVLRAQRVRLRADHIQQVAGRQAAPADEEAGVLLVHGLLPDSAPGEVHAQQFAHVAVHVASLQVAGRRSQSCRTTASSCPTKRPGPAKLGHIRRKSQGHRPSRRRMASMP
jgi:hypothetical protein